MNTGTIVVVVLVAVAIAFLGGYLIASTRRAVGARDAADAERERARRRTESMTDSEAWDEFRDNFGDK